MSPIFALIDCNNFFVSCERLFQPSLNGKPVVVLSSNDGCAISRSREAKELGIPMGAPAFKYRQLFKTEKVVQFSANFELYGDISERITRLLTGITPRIEVYSVDESFLDLSRLKITDYAAWAQQVRYRLWREIGVPVSIGIAPTKTLAKLANHRAKKLAELNGVLDLMDFTSPHASAHLLQTPIEDIWGIGWRLAPKLKAEGIYTALDLARLRPQHAGQLMGVHGRQLVAELNGQICHPMEMLGRVRQTIMKGRMFGHDTNQFSVIEAAIASLTARATYHLRREGLSARSASLSLGTNRHKPGYQRQNYTVQFHTPTADTGRITAELVRAAQERFNPQLEYHRANVLLFDLVDRHRLQPDLLGMVDPHSHETELARLAAFDHINARYGRTAIRYAAEDLSDAWQPKHQSRSPRYTTEWSELPVARIAPNGSHVRYNQEIMKLHIITIGQPKLAYAKEGWNEYWNRLKHYHQVRATHISDKQNDTEHILAAGGNSYKIALAIPGRELSSPELADFLDKRAQESREISFLVGGPDGLPPEVLEKVDFQWSFGALTYPHDLAMVILLETLYRASTINSGHPYHR